jgi:hypothetical protein
MVLEAKGMDLLPERLKWTLNLGISQTRNFNGSGVTGSFFGFSNMGLTILK